jgi:hypothetical protein
MVKGLKISNDYHWDLASNRPFSKEFHPVTHLEFGPQSAESPPKMAVPLVGKIRSLFAPSWRDRRQEDMIIDA